MPLFTTTQELREYVSFIDASISFKGFKMPLYHAERDVKKLIGEAVYNLVAEPGSGSGVGAEETDLDINLKYAVAMLTYLYFAPTTDVSHGDDGRKVTINADKEKLPFEWMLDRDNQALLNNSNRSIDALIEYLDDNEDDIAEWKDSDAKKASRALFINNAAQFSDVYVIDRTFYLRVLPFIKNVEDTDIQALLSSEVYASLKSEFETSNTLEDTILLNLIRRAIVPFVMAKAYKGMSIGLIPGGATQSIISERTTTQGKIAAVKDLIDATIVRFQEEGNAAAFKLSEYLVAKSAKDAQEDYVPTDDSNLEYNDADNKFLSL